MVNAILTAFAACMVGCAAPGNPLPPTLNLPEVQSIYPLSAVRVGNEVRLHWSTPARTTDKLPVKGAIVAEICRSAAPATSACNTVQRIPVTSGETDAVDPLSASLSAGAPGLLAYRIRLMNSAGRDAGLSGPVYAASGAAPPPVAGFAAEATSAGIELTWQRQDAISVVELDRILLTPPAATSTPRNDLAGPEMAEVTLRASDPADQGEVGGTPPAGHDRGGMVDRTVKLDRSYRYTAQRVIRLAIDGHPVELRSAPSAPLTVAVRDVFPPSVPQGLLAVPESVGSRPAIALSWEPVLDQNVKTRVGGYKVYRRDDAGSAWKLLGPVAVTAYQDSAITPGRIYTYRVTAYSTAGNESAPSAEAAETAPTMRNAVQP